ncbi:hypothetical protein PMAYCL1PPCAC_21390, partial [Pristionchus mayeri]
LIVFAVILQTVRGACPEGLEPVRDGQCRGFLTNATLTHSEPLLFATSKCAEIQALPVIIHNEEQQSYWTAQKKKMGNFLVLGIVCNDVKKWQWVDGSPVDYIPATANADIHSACTPTYSWVIDDDTGFWTRWNSPYETDSFSIFCTAQLE